MKDLLKQWGKHVVALILFLGLVMTYFSPAVFDGKVIMQGDNIKATGMGSSFSPVSSYISRIATSW
mgnify:CR=1 FL=1